MHISQIALQLYTLRNHCRSTADFAATCRRVAEIGYRAVQVSGIDRAVTSETEIAAICADHGLTICATHEASDEILEQPQQVVERLRRMGCTLTAYPYPKGVDFSDEASVNSMIQRLDAAGAVLAEAGMTLCYHNHQIEFRRLGGQLILERIFAQTDPKHLQAELDTYWVQFGGGDPVSWMRKVAKRQPLLHLKDYRINPQNQAEFTEVGAGNLDMPGIIAAAEAGGCRWFVVEQDVCPGDAFEAVASSFRFLQTLAK